MKNARVFALACASILAVSSAGGEDRALVIFADRDDDDDDGLPDAETAGPPQAAAAADVRGLDAAAGQSLKAIEGDGLRVVTSDSVLRAGAVRAKTNGRVLGVQGVHAGSGKLVFSRLALKVNVVELFTVDGRGERVDLVTSHASISRELPASLSAEPGSAPDDRDALRWVGAGPSGAVPVLARIVSTRPTGQPLDALEAVLLRRAPCPKGVPAGLECRQTPLIRATSDVIDRSHPESAARSLRAEVGGRLSLVIDGKKAQAIRVGGPRQTALGPLERFRGRIRLRLVRLVPGGAPPVGGDERGGLALAREEIQMASALWGQCGIHFGYGDDIDVKVVDPPPPHLLAVGCDLGVPASGGEIAFRMGNRAVRVPTAAGQTPTAVANAVAMAVQKAGLRATVSANARIAPGALRTVDVLIRRPDGALATITPMTNRLSTDPTLDVCLGEVDLADGLTHFTDFDAVSGTVEERSLIKAFDDGDPATLEVFVIPSFARTGRIGESFIYSNGASVRNAVIIDRAGILAGARSYALAHELGHILLDLPGHPDDFGVDQPTSLMDADATDPTIFGPRRLSIAECERAIRQSGPRAPVPLLEAWPLFQRKRP